MLCDYVTMRCDVALMLRGTITELCDVKIFAMIFAKLVNKENYHNINT
jgi:hypothetical protein